MDVTAAFSFVSASVPVMEVAAGEYGESNIRRLIGAVIDGKCEPFQEEFQHRQSSSLTSPADQSSTAADDGDGPSANRKETCFVVDEECNGGAFDGAKNCAILKSGVG